MSKWHWWIRFLPLAAIAGATLTSPVSAQPVVPSPSQPTGASLLPANVTWVVNLEALPERSAPTEDGDAVGTLKQFTYLEVTGYQGEWAHVLNPRTKVAGFVPSDAIGPIDGLPPPYLTAEAPPAVDEITRTAGRSAAPRCPSIPRLTPTRRPRPWSTTPRSRLPTASRATTAKPGIAPPTATTCRTPRSGCRGPRCGRLRVAGSMWICASRRCWSPTTATSQCSRR
jgi:hypothetical protein